MSETPKFPFTRANYLIMIGGIIVLFIGFFIMSIDKETFGFGFYGLTLGPIVVIIGFLIQFVAIFFKPRSKSQNS